MNASDDSSPPKPYGGDGSPAANSEAEAAKPKRRRTPRKTLQAASEDGGSSPGDAAGGGAERPDGEAAGGSAKPRRRAVAKVPTAAEVFGTAVMQQLRLNDAAPSAGAMQLAPAAATAAAPTAPTAQPNQAGDAGPSDQGGEPGEGYSGERGAPSEDRDGNRRRNRNRRRGRRGADRERGGGPDAILPGAAAAAGSHPPRPGQQPWQGPDAQAVFNQVLAGEFDGEVEAGAEAASEESAVVVEGDSVVPDASAANLPSEEQAAGADAASSEGSASPARDHKRVLAPDIEAPKLHKVLAQSGVGSRRDLEQAIAEGRVTVNAEVAHTGQRISWGDRIQLDGKPVRYRIAPPPPRVLAYHKPVGEVVTHEDPQQRPTVFRRLPHLPQGKWQSVGRLDINTEGLLLFTTSGELANQLMHPRFGVEREYAVRSLGVLDEAAKARLLEGVEIDGQRAAFKSIDDGGGEGVNHWYRVVITEGRNREVRRLFEAVGHAVSRLIRIRYGSVVLPRGLKRGVWVDLTDQDLRNLRRLASGPRPQPVPNGPHGPGVPHGPGEAMGPPGPGAGKRGRNRRGRGGKGELPLRVGDEGYDPTQRAPGAESERGPRPPRGPERPPGAGRHGNRTGGPRPDKSPRGDRGDRGDRSDRSDRGPRPARGEPGEGGAIPNPLQQTFDKRALQADRRQRREMSEDGPIPNPLQQTFDKRALQRDRVVQRDLPEDGPIPNPLQQTYDKRFAQLNKAARKAEAPDPENIPDPMQTSVGYIGADALRRKGAGARGGRRGGPKTGGGFGGGAPFGGGAAHGPAGGGGGGGGGRKRPRGPRGGGRSR